jgi:hypothetical protein
MSAALKRNRPATDSAAAVFPSQFLIQIDHTRKYLLNQGPCGAVGSSPVNACIQPGDLSHAPYTFGTACATRSAGQRFVGGEAEPNAFEFASTPNPAIKHATAHPLID